jgi:hypothetical protein
MMSIKAIARHLTAVNAGKVEKTNIIGIRKAINALEQEREPAPEMSDAVFELECAIQEKEPLVTGALFLSGLDVLQNPRYRKRWTDSEREIIEDLDTIRLARFDRVNPRGWQSVPVYRAKGRNGESFLYRNIPWQTAYFGGLEDGPRVVPEHGE